MKETKNSRTDLNLIKRFIFFSTLFCSALGCLLCRFILKGAEGSGVPVRLCCFPTPDCSSKSSEWSTVAVQEHDEPGRECRCAGQRGTSVITCTGKLRCLHLHQARPGLSLSLSPSLRRDQVIPPAAGCEGLLTVLHHLLLLVFTPPVSSCPVQDEVLCHTCRLPYAGCHRHRAASRPFASRSPR